MSTGGKRGNRSEEVLEIVMMVKEEDARTEPLFIFWPLWDLENLGGLLEDLVS